MANNITKYGIKEVADVRFYKVGEVSVDAATGAVTPTGTPKLVLDTLKVSTIEFTGEQSEARGGKGNPPLIIWDYGREINVTLEDALMSTEMLHLMFGSEATGGHIEINANSFPGTYAVVGKTFARDDDGKDHVFTFYIPKAKIQSENTLTMEAEGDPSVFNLSLRVLADDGKMMELILDTANEKGTIAETEWTNGTTAKYAITFVSEDVVTTLYVAKGAAITAPSAPEGKKWDMLSGATATGNATYYAVDAQ
jgi:hypothetical protein